MSVIGADGIAHPTRYSDTWKNSYPKTVIFGCQGPSCLPWGTTSLPYSLYK